MRLKEYLRELNKTASYERIARKISPDCTGKHIYNWITLGCAPIGYMRDNLREVFGEDARQILELSMRERILRFRKKHELSNTELAATFGVSESLVGMWLYGRTEPNMKTIERLISEYPELEDDLE